MSLLHRREDAEAIESIQSIWGDLNELKLWLPCLTLLKAARDETDTARKAAAISQAVNAVVLHVLKLSPEESNVSRGVALLADLVRTDPRVRELAAKLFFQR